MSPGARTKFRVGIIVIRHVLRLVERTEIEVSDLKPSILLLQKDHINWLNLRNRYSRLSQASIGEEIHHSTLTDSVFATQHVQILTSLKLSELRRELTLCAVADWNVAVPGGSSEVRTSYVLEYCTVCPVAWLGDFWFALSAE